MPGGTDPSSVDRDHGAHLSKGRNHRLGADRIAEGRLASERIVIVRKHGERRPPSGSEVITDTNLSDQGIGLNDDEVVLRGLAQHILG